MSQHAAPAMSYPAEPSWLAGMAMALLWLAAAAVTLAWASLAAGQAAVWLGWAGLLLSGLAMARYWRAGPRGQLLWDGQVWLWRSRAYPAGTEVDCPEIVLDAQILIVVRMCNRAGASWVLCLQAQSDRRSWLDLRRALYARAPVSAQAIDGPGRS
jgi:hypothetical protein